MTNREHILQTDVYDVLMMMSRNLDSMNEHRITPNCIVEQIAGESQRFRCVQNYNALQGCESCLQAWLNEPYDGWR